MSPTGGRRWTWPLPAAALGTMGTIPSRVPLSPNPEGTPERLQVKNLGGGFPNLYRGGDKFGGEDAKFVGFWGRGHTSPERKDEGTKRDVKFVPNRVEPRGAAPGGAQPPGPPQK